MISAEIDMTVSGMGTQRQRQCFFFEDGGEGFLKGRKMLRLEFSKWNGGDGSEGESRASPASGESSGLITLNFILKVK